MVVVAHQRLCIDNFSADVSQYSKPLLCKDRLVGGQVAPMAYFPPARLDTHPIYDGTWYGVTIYTCHPHDLYRLVLFGTRPGTHNGSGKVCGKCKEIIPQKKYSLFSEYFFYIYHSIYSISS